MKLASALLVPATVLAASCAATAPTCREPAPQQAAPSAAFDPDALDAIVRRAMAEWHVPGLALAVVSADSVLFARGYGVREVGRPEAVDTRTMFGLMSPTKTFTATALAMLAEEGRLSLDDRVVDHLPSFRVADPALTADLRIRDLLSHRTGYEENHRLWYRRGGTPADVAPRAVELAAIAGPGTEFHYNNVMYVVAGQVIEAVSGLPWDAFIRERILLPLGMEQTTSSHFPLATRTNVAAPHARRFFGRLGGIRPIPYFDTSNIGPAGSLHTNVDEMAAWLRLHLAGGTHDGRRLLTPESVRELQAAHVMLPDVADPRIGGAQAWGPLCGIVDPDTRGYGLGWFTSDFRGHRAVTHGGGINGQRSAVGLLPDLGVGVVILTNLQDTEISLALMYHLFDLFLDVEDREWSTIYVRAQ